MNGGREIVPLPTTMHPAMSAIHYGQSIFEGLKANRTVKRGKYFQANMNKKIQ